MSYKTKPIEDPKYKAFIRTKDCLVGYQCSGDVVPHHTETGGMGMKCSDYKAVPLCAKHHNGMIMGGYKHNIHNLGKDKFQQYHTIDLAQRIQDLNGEYNSGM